MRSLQKDYCPGFFDLASAGGVVDAGEDDRVGAMRELEEELGVTSVDLGQEVLVAKYEPEDGSDKLFQNIYLVRDFDDENTTLIFQDKEVERIEKWPVSEIEAKISDQELKVTPDSKHAWNALVANLG